MLISTYQNIIMKIAFIASIFYFVKVKSTEECLENHIMDELTKKCIDCPAGVYGFRCKLTCPFPTFGQNCLEICNCVKDQCDHINGCKKGTTPHDRVEEQNVTLSTEFTYENHSTFTISPNTSSSPMARETVKNKYRTSVLIAVTGTVISTLLLVAVGFELRSRITLRRREPNYDQENMFCENGNVYLTNKIPFLDVNGDINLVGHVIKSHKARRESHISHKARRALWKI